MKKNLLFFILSFFTITAFAQGGIQQLPKSWSLNLAQNPETIVLPRLNMESIYAQDSINDAIKNIPWRFGLERNFSISIDNDGLWTTLDDGSRVWRALIQSPGALNISINFNEFYIPEGSQFHLFNAAHTDVSRTYTFNDNSEYRQMGSWFVEGDTLWLEYFEPKNSVETPEIEVSSIIHGYRLGEVIILPDGTRGINESGDCNYDVNCPIGADFDSKKDVLKKSIALVNLGNGYLCSASLINNTRNDKTPYLLTANHCLENSDPAFWSVRFNWVSPNPACGTGADSGNMQTNFTMSGAKLISNNSYSDFALVELQNRIPNSWDVAFAGWDNSDTNPQFEVGIHHPNGDIMKVCRDNSGAQKTDANGTQVWLIGGGAHGTGNGWEIGTTESGSSGSPLFNEEGKIIGQLYAGQAGCDGLQNNNDYDIYGRLGISWNTGNTPQKRLKEWLDPAETGQTSIETLQNILNTPEFDMTGDLQIFPNPASSALTVLNYKYPNLKYAFVNALGQIYGKGSLSSTMNSISVSGMSEGIYFLYLLDEDTNDSITKKIVVKR
ncbi:T9SS type A sorting domain-containing protein [Aequorivita echinoideorum]|uniref:T9SS type A sorting domain-containing protein n=1 Tax=Aequorivita echinoideorum TaxID=1549647 RepID=A0ABS5S0G1_9FLAO|nr:T9SS type A sorting domain-containing protein [Aequorivita echinoideorum]MBT0606650.1 T9SS type A sorting domain-containing protein [Aequorivita echinoideorum]